MANLKTIIAVIFCVGVALAANSQAAYDVKWTFGNNGSLDYRLDAFSPNDADLGPVGAGDPTLNVLIGDRYQVTITNFSIHPFEVLAKGSDSSSDTVLLSMQTSGSMEGDPDVNWIDDGSGTATFTLTQGLYDAMTTPTQQPGYRCGVHINTMRGNFNVQNTPLDDPVPAAIPDGNTTIELEAIATGLSSPVDMVDPDDGTDRLFVVDQTGSVFIIKDGTLLSQPFLDVSDRLVSLNSGFDERGLLSLALHPDFTDPDSTGYKTLYTYTSEPADMTADFTTDPAPDSVDHQSVVAEWLVDVNDPNVVDVNSRRELMRIDQPQFNHDGGMLVFGPKDFLYIALGDGGGANDTGDGHGEAGNGQNINTVHGSILRIDPLDPSLTTGSGNPISANGQYRIPWDNPFVDANGVDEIFAYGFRNPFRFSYDRQDDLFIVADVGQNDIEEVDIMPKGGNFGWNLKEGSFRFNADSGTVSDFVSDLPEDLIDPIAEYDHDEGISIIGGYIYRGQEVLKLQGNYVFGDFSGRLFFLDPDDPRIRELVIGPQDRALGFLLKGFGQGAQGEMYALVSQNAGPFGTSGQVLKIVNLCQSELAGDIDGNCTVDFNDLAVLASDWLECVHRNQANCP